MPPAAIQELRDLTRTRKQLMLRDGVEYRDLGPVHVDRHDKTKTINRFVKRLRDLGCAVEIREAA